MADGKGSDSGSALTRLESLTAVIVVGVLGVALGLVALAMPTHTVEKRNIGYTQTAKFGYSAKTPAKSAYGPDGLSAGEPILADVAGPVVVDLHYELKSDATTAKLQGTAGLVATVQVAQGLSRDFPIAAATVFDGARANVAGELPIDRMVKYLRSVQSDFGQVGTIITGNIEVRSKIAIAGILGGQRFKAKYAPKLTFALNGTVLTLGQNGLGATGASPADALKQSKKGSVSYQAQVDNTVPLVIVHPSVLLARILGFSVAALSLILGLLLARPLLRSDDPAQEPNRIRTLYGGHLIDVSTVSRGSEPVAEVSSIDALADLAKKYESKIMHVSEAEGDSYLVWDQGMFYRYRPAGRPMVEDDAISLAESLPVAGLNGKPDPVTAAHRMDS